MILGALAELKSSCALAKTGSNIYLSGTGSFALLRFEPALRCSAVPRVIWASYT